jgi:hypothetical protein
MSDKGHIRCQCRRGFNPCLLEEAEESIQNVGLVAVSESCGLFEGTRCRRLKSEEFRKM